MFPLSVRAMLSISRDSRTPPSTIATRLSSSWETLMSMTFDMNLLFRPRRRAHPPGPQASAALLRGHSLQPLPERAREVEANGPDPARRGGVAGRTAHGPALPRSAPQISVRGSEEKGLRQESLRVLAGRPRVQRLGDRPTL